MNIIDYRRKISKTGSRGVLNGYQVNQMALWSKIHKSEALGLALYGYLRAIAWAITLVEHYVDVQTLISVGDGTCV